MTKNHDNADDVLLKLEMIFAGLKSSAIGVLRAGETSPLLDGTHLMLRSGISYIFSFANWLFSLLAMLCCS